ncbi:protein kinase [Streptomyces sp. NPDC047706]|uniref:protein kinase n=1 Tax=Streptomyces sp. NPDC047706 TaxID=3365486 RepID=UPI00371FD969
MDDYAGRVLADRYRLPLPPSDEYELTETRAFDTYSGQEVLVRQVPLPEVVEAEVLDAEGLPEGFTARDRAARRPAAGRAGAVRRPTDPAVRRAVEAAQAAAAIPDHPRLDQVFDVFAEGGSLWVVSELVAARPLAALLAEQPLTPYRAAEVASDVLTALRVLHAHGWVHRNITARTVLVCDDGRIMLTGLAVGAAEEALCGYDPVPAPPYDDDGGDGGGPARALGPARGTFAAAGVHELNEAGTPGAGALGGGDPEAARRAAIEARAAGGLPVPAVDASGGVGGSAAPARRAQESGGDIRAARAGAIAAYRAGARAAARVQETRQSGRAALPGARPAPEGGPEQPHTRGPDGNPPGQIADPYGVRATPWHGATPRDTVAGPGHPGQSQANGRAQPVLPPHGNGLAQPGGPPYTGGLAQPGLAPHGGRLTSPGLPAQGDGPPRPGTFPARGNGPAHPGVPAPAREVAPQAPLGRAAAQDGTRWGDLVADTPAPRRGPATALAAERARQARMAVVGPVTERWAPEQAGPVHENWQLAPPIGPSTDLWALGALLFRAVQGHAPYPEDSTAELVQLVCAEPPAFAEECGPLRPVVESLLRQDPTERLDFEELRGWLRSLVRSAPEPEAGLHVVAAPPPDASRLPIVRRRGELVRRRRAGLPARHGRHKRDREKTRSPRSLGRTLLLLILLALAGAIAYAMLFMPKAGEGGAGGPSPDRTGAAGQTGEAPGPTPEASSEPRPDQNSPDDGPAGSRSGAAEGFTLHDDPEGFRVAVAEGWQRAPKNGSGQVVYSQGDFELILAPGRDGADEYGSDPMAYQREREPELRPYRESSWATSTGLKTIEVGGRTMAEGQFTWSDDAGRDLFVRNLAMLVDGRYHVLQVRGPEAERDQVTRLYEQAAATYQATG